MSDTEVIVIGAGHNALVCAGYIAKAGYKVTVIERRHIVGGAVVTEEIIPGYKFDLGGSAHILINHTPIVADLELTKYGLDYIDLDPLFFAPFPDGTHFTIWKDIDKTCESIAQISPEDAENYYRFVTTWKPVAESMVEAFLNPPTAWNIFRFMMFKTGQRKDWMERLTDILGTYGQVVNTHFKDKRVQSLIAWMAAQSGPPSTEPMSAPFALWHPMYHVSGMKRPRGGSGMLTQALANMIKAHGGTIITSAPVQRILTENGRIAGVETVSGEQYTAKVVVSGAHIHTTMKMLDAESVPERARRLVDKARVGNGFGMIVRYAMNELPNYTALPTDSTLDPNPQHVALQFICPDMAYLNRAYGDYLGGKPSENPALVAMTFSASDKTLAPAGKHTLFLWGQYYPYELASGEHWDDIAEREADRMLDTLAQYAPNVRSAVIDKLIETPLYLERELGLLRGNVMHLEMSIDQMFMMRPALSMSNYRAPVKGLYFTGASTHPGGGIMGAAGRNTAQVLLHDLSRWRWLRRGRKLYSDDKTTEH